MFIILTLTITSTMALQDICLDLGLPTAFGCCNRPHPTPPPQRKSLASFEECFGGVPSALRGPPPPGPASGAPQPLVPPTPSAAPQPLVPPTPLAAPQPPVPPPSSAAPQPPVPPPPSAVPQLSVAPPPSALLQPPPPPAPSASAISPQHSSSNSSQLSVLPSCDIELCVAKKMGFTTEDGSINKTAMIDELNNEFGVSAKNLRKKCFDVTDLSMYGPPDLCEIVKIRYCVHVAAAINCPEWVDNDECKRYKELAGKCAA